MAPVSASSILIALHTSSVYYDEPSASTLWRSCTCDPDYPRHLVTMAAALSVSYYNKYKMPAGLPVLSRSSLTW